MCSLPSHADVLAPSSDCRSLQANGAKVISSAQVREAEGNAALTKSHGVEVLDLFDQVVYRQRILRESNPACERLCPGGNRSELTESIVAEILSLT